MANLATFEPSKAGKYDAGQITIFFDHRRFKSQQDKLSVFQTYYLEGLSYLGWPSLMSNPDLEPGKLRLIWYTHAGSEGQRDFPLWQAREVREAFDTLSFEGFRPMVIGWSAENPFPDLPGGSQPPPPPAKPKEPKRATTYSASMSGHAKNGGDTPHDRVMAIITAEDEREAKARADLVALGEQEKSGGAA